MVKEKLQRLLFPDGIYYNREKDTVRAERVNGVFQLIAQLTGSFDIKETGQTRNISDLSCSVELRGVEPRSGEGIKCAFYTFIYNCFSYTSRFTEDQPIS